MSSGSDHPLDSGPPDRDDSGELFVRLFEYRASGPEDTSIFIEARIRADGDLIVSGYDLGHAPRVFFDHEDYEYWTIVPRAMKDRLMLALLRERLAGDARAVSAFRDFLGKNDIPADHGCYP